PIPLSGHAEKGCQIQVIIFSRQARQTTEEARDSQPKNRRTSRKRSLVKSCQNVSRETTFRSGSGRKSYKACPSSPPLDEWDCAKIWHFRRVEQRLTLFAPVSAIVC